MDNERINKIYLMAEDKNIHIYELIKKDSSYDNQLEVCKELYLSLKKFGRIK